MDWVVPVARPLAIALDQRAERSTAPLAHRQSPCYKSNLFRRLCQRHRLKHIRTKFYSQLCAKRRHMVLESIKGQFGAAGNSSQHERIVPLKHLPPDSGY